MRIQFLAFYLFQWHYSYVLCAHSLPVLCPTFDAGGTGGSCAQAGQTSPRGPSGEANERNANAAKYQVCFY